MTVGFKSAGEVEIGPSGRSVTVAWGRSWQGNWGCCLGGVGDLVELGGGKTRRPLSAPGPGGRSSVNLGVNEKRS